MRSSPWQPKSVTAAIFLVWFVELLFVSLKMFGLIDWSWGWVVSPVFIAMILSAATLIVIATITKILG